MLDILRSTLMFGIAQNGVNWRQMSSLLAYEVLSKHSTQFLNLGAHYIQRMWAAAHPGRATKGSSAAERKVLPALPSATIMCQRAYDATRGSGVPNRVDAVLQYVCTLPVASSLIFNGTDFTPELKTGIQVGDDVYFRIIRRDEDGKGNNAYIQFELSAYTNDVQHLQRFIDNCSAAMDRRMRNKLGENLYFFNQIPLEARDSMPMRMNNDVLVFRKTLFTTNRSFDNVFYEGKEEVEERVNRFLHRQDYYDKIGAPHTLSMILQGGPGLGKTSTVKAAAKVARRHIINVKLSQIESNEQLENLFYNDTIMVLDPITNKIDAIQIPISERVYLCEDVDAMKSVILRRDQDGGAGVEKESDETPASYETYMMNRDLHRETASAAAGIRMPPKKKKLDLSTLLNVMDGTLEASSRMMFLATNHPERLDPAFLRPGRIDLIVKYKRASRAIVAAMLTHIFQDEGTTFNVSDFEAEVDEKWSQAELQTIAFAHLKDPDEVVRIVNEEKPNERFAYSYVNDKQVAN
jgi:hypothetical protein